MVEKTAGKNKNCMTFLDRVDLFGAPPPKLNFKRRTNIHSIPGVICTILFVLIIITCIVLQAVKLIQRSDS